MTLNELVAALQDHAGEDTKAVYIVNAAGNRHEVAKVEDDDEAVLIHASAESLG